jgi:hypothetical protein
MQHVADNRPAWFDWHGILSQDPVIVERLDGAIFFFKREPAVDECNHLQIIPGDRKVNGNRYGMRLWDRDRV